MTAQSPGKTKSLATGYEVTLRQTWSRGGAPRPQCAFKMSMINVPCNSH